MVAMTALRRTMIRIPLLLVHLVGGNLVGDAHSHGGYHFVYVYYRFGATIFRSIQWFDSDGFGSRVLVLRSMLHEELPTGLVGV
jgi:hypothetical protein